MDVQVNVAGVCGGIYMQISQKTLYPKGIFRGFFLGFTFNTLRGDRPGFQAFDRDVTTAGFADSVRSVLDAFQGLTDFDDQFSFSVPNAEHEVSISLKGSTICGIGKTGDLSCHTRYRLAGLGQQVL